MRKIINATFVIILGIAIVLSLASCGSYKAEDGTAIEQSDEKQYGYNYSGYEESESEKEISSDSITEDRKIIKTVNMDVETKDYDGFNSSLQTLINSCGGYIQKSERYDRDTDAYNRYSNYTVRIPADKLSEFTKGVEGKATVTHFTENADDITENYVDTEVRINSLKTELETLTKLYEKADTLDYVISLQDRITEVRYELEKYEALLKSYEKQVSYSTVYIRVNEVERESIVEKQGTFEEIKTNLSENISDIGEGARRFFIFIVSALPYLAIIAVIVVIVVLVVKAINRKNKKNRDNK